MKNKFTAVLLLGITIVTLSSCAASRSRYGCPTAKSAAPLPTSVVAAK